MQHTLIDPFELVSTLPAPLPPARARMATISVDVDFSDAYATTTAPRSEPEVAVPDSWTRIRCWCSED